MIDWTKPLEAYHTDGRVVPVELANGPDGDGDYELTEPLEPSTGGAYFFTRDGKQRYPLKSGSRPWRIRNRQTAIRYGDEFLVGTRILRATGETKVTERGDTVVQFHEASGRGYWMRLDDIERIVDPEEPDHLTITITGPQGCGKTRTAGAIRKMLRLHGCTIEEGDETYDRETLRAALEGHRVTVIDASGDDQ